MADKREIKRKLNAAEKLAHDQCVQHIYDWMGYSTNARLPKFVYGLLGRFHNENNYSYEVILETMYFCDDMVERSLKKEFDSDNGKLKYICAIIRDHLNDGMKQFGRKQKAIQESQKNMSQYIPTEDELANIGTSQSQKDRSNLDEAMKSILGDLY